MNAYNDIANKVKVKISEVKEEISKNKGKKEQVTIPLDTSLDNIDVDKLKEHIKVLENEKKIANSIKNNSINPNREPVLLSSDLSELKSRFNNLCSIKDKMSKEIQNGIPEGEKVSTDISRSLIIKNYKEVDNVSKPDSNLLVILESLESINEELPSPYNTGVTQEDIDVIEKELEKYKYKDINSTEDDLKSILLKFNKKYQSIPANIKKISLKYPKSIIQYINFL